jgi:hypothetical protein
MPIEHHQPRQVPQVASNLDRCVVHPTNPVAARAPRPSLRSTIAPPSAARFSGCKISKEILMIMKKVCAALLAVPLLLAPTMPAVAQRGGHGQFNNGAYRGGHGGNYGDRRHGHYNRNQGGIGPGKGAAIGAAGGVALGMLFGGGLQGAIVGGAAGAGIGAIAGQANQNNRRGYRH